ncbi:hypothetical protein DEDE109153_00150 [Deinococcus deserti]
MCEQHARLYPLSGELSLHPPGLGPLKSEVSLDANQHVRSTQHYSPQYCPEVIVTVSEGSAIGVTAVRIRRGEADRAHPPSGGAW